MQVPLSFSPRSNAFSINIVPCKHDNDYSGHVVHAMLTWTLTSIDVVFMNC